MQGLYIPVGGTFTGHFPRGWIESRILDLLIQGAHALEMERNDGKEMVGALGVARTASTNRTRDGEREAD